ncbi:hypothetical protein R1521_35405 [Rhizobium brockwellii]|uniref:Uncharacterized protein n=1 Tax=Rhizobium brockwellii TaxID=3019932 RepID=A0ABU3YXY4_9HYPH|nr:MULTISPECIES: hypothetical protein [Rhizobium]MDV4159021.1 hypothetical protein [Rhizobium brockwellii]MDV4183741.1 hypothetical protein [Rhizobium brockwellii]MDV4190714.1 hypothetical protein [Rhizobium brockwellii]NZD54942.1 hypothetical protein [Rhizobium leguminosarum]RWX26925.1 hypothetical protein EHH54_34250 [Rhizobium leguminosarum]
MKEDDPFRTSPDPPGYGALKVVERRSGYRTALKIGKHEKQALYNIQVGNDDRLRWRHCLQTIDAVDVISMKM